MRKLLFTVIFVSLTCSISAQMVPGAANNNMSHGYMDIRRTYSPPTYKPNIPNYHFDPPTYPEIFNERGKFGLRYVHSGKYLIVAKPEYDYMECWNPNNLDKRYYYKGYYLVKKNNKFGIVYSEEDRGKILSDSIPSIWDAVEQCNDTNDGVFIVKSKNKYGLYKCDWFTISHEKRALDCEFDHIELVHKSSHVGLFVVEANNKYGLYKCHWFGSREEKILDCEFDHIKLVHKSSNVGFVSVKSKNKYGLYAYEEASYSGGEKILDCEFDQIEVVEKSPNKKYEILAYKNFIISRHVLKFGKTELKRIRKVK